MAKRGHFLGDAMQGDVTIDDSGVGVRGKAEKAAPKSSACPDGFHVSRSDNGGYIVECTYPIKTSAKKGVSDGYVKPTKHVFADKAEMLAFIHEQTGGGEVEE